jgi:predicted nucleic acid-binding protein
MAGAFVDTSALAKHYHIERGSAEMDRLWADADRSIFISRVGVVETVSVFAGKVRTGILSSAAFTALRKRFLSDVGQGRPKLVRLLVQHFKVADRFIRQHGLTNRLRTLDALQLAVALDLQSRGMIDTLVSSDQHLLNVAHAEGVAVFDPENP